VINMSVHGGPARKGDTSVAPQSNHLGEHLIPGRWSVKLAVYI
jgi:hypothetical protein